MKVRVVYFAAARELAGRAQEEFAHAPVEVSLAEFAHWLGRERPRLAPYLARMRFALNGEFADREARVGDGDEVTVLPPVAGGSALAELRDRPLSIDEAIAAVRHAGAGAIALFLGVVRDHHRGQPVARLDYEAHRALAEREMRSILDELAQTHEGVRLCALHRVGELALGELAVVVAVSAPHREEAFRACQLAIERIKVSVPIWKKEWSPDGSATWINLE